MNESEIPKDQREVEPAPRVVELVSELTDGTLSAEQLAELRELLSQDEDALAWYCQWMSIHSYLHLDLALAQPIVATSRLTGAANLLAPAHRPPAGRRLRRGYLAAAGIAAALAASIAIWMLPEPAQPSGETALASASGGLVLNEDARREFQRTDRTTVAVLSRAADLVSPSTTPLKPGAAIPAGRFVIDSGVAQLEFLSGANVVVEGPADIDLVSTKAIFCRRGKVRARVPSQAHGFTIETPTHRAIDLGTEFAVDVDADRATEIHVLDGEVKLQDKTNVAAEEKRLLVGNGFRADAEGRGEQILADAEGFIGAERLLELSERDSRSQYSVWRKFSRSLARNSDVLMYFDFQDHFPWQRVLHQDGPLNEESLEGAIVGCRWTEGRWPGKQALEFKGTEDRVRVRIPGEYDSVSMACWVRIDGFDRWLSALLLTEGHDLGEVHWQFTETGQLLLGVKAEPDQSQDYLSDVVLRPRDVGRWVHLACVYNREAETITHYVDGRPVKVLPIRKHIKLRFGDAELGNWVPEDFIDHRIRSLNGRVDEFVLFNKAISDGEVQQIYQAGQPNL